MIDGLLLNGARASPPNSTILAPTPIKLQKSMLNTPMSLSSPSMISSSFSSPLQNTVVPVTTHSNSNHSPTVDWTHERIMCLVKLYEKKSVLWNPSNPEYFHRDIRNMVYDDLVRELNIPELTVNETKRKLENLRSYFRRETKKLHDHERKTNEKILSRWPYYESLQFIHEFMSVKNESGAEVGFAKNMNRGSSYSLPTMKREPDECAVQVPVGSTTGITESPLSTVGAFHLSNNADLVAVLKALQGPLAETAVSCFGLQPTEVNANMPGAPQPDSNGHHSPYHSPNHPISPRRRERNGDLLRSETPVAPLLPQNLAIPSLTKPDSPGDVCKKRKLYERQSSSRSTEGVEPADLCGDYGRTVAHQLRLLDSYSRDRCRLQIDQLIFNFMHKEKSDLEPSSPTTMDDSQPSVPAED